MGNEQSCQHLSSVLKWVATLSDLGQTPFRFVFTGKMTKIDLDLDF